MRRCQWNFLIALLVVALSTNASLQPPACAQITTSNAQEVDFVKNLTKRDPSKALHYLNERLLSEPNNLYLLITTGNLELGMDQPELSSKLFERYLVLDPKSQDAALYVQLATAYILMQRRDKAVSTYNTAISKIANNGSLFCERGCVYGSLKQLDKGISDLNKAVLLQPKNVHFLKERGELYAQKQNYEKALADFTSVIKMGRGNALTFTKRAEVYKKLNRADLAKKDMEQANKFSRKLLDDGP